MGWKKIFISCTAGNILELYNFILFSCFANVLSKLYFPNTDSHVGLMLTFGIFASGCLMRPLGALFFGHIGDKYSRKKTLIISLSIVTASTTLIGLLPTYSEIGIYASVLLLLCRLAQGFSMSGEEVGAAILLSEIMPKNRQGLAGSIVLGSVYIGLLIGSLVALILTLSLTEAELYAWGWRIPFLLSLVFGIVFTIIRIKQTESIEFIKARKQNVLLRNPIVKTLMDKDSRNNTINGIFACAALASPLYLFAVYVPTKLTALFGFNGSMLVCSISFIITAALVVLVGMLVDRIGFIKPIFLSCIGLLIFSYPIFFLLSINTALSVLTAQSVLIILISLNAGSLMTMLINSFPINIRFSGVAISFNLGMTLFGSTTPILVLYIEQASGSLRAPFTCLVLASIFTLYAITQYNKKNHSSSYDGRELFTTNKELI